MLKNILSNRFVVLYIIPFTIGSISVLSFEPFNLTIINFIILPLFFYFMVYINKKTKGFYRKKPYKKNFFIFGLLFGFSFYLSGVSWITNSLTFDDSFKVLIPFALILIPLFRMFIRHLHTKTVENKRKLTYSVHILYSSFNSNIIFHIFSLTNKS